MGLLQTATAAGTLHFAFSALPDGGMRDRPRVGDEFEYRISSYREEHGRSDGRRDGRYESRSGAVRPTAALLRPLKRGTVVLEWLVEEWWLAKVTRVPTRGGSGGKGGKGGKGGVPAEAESGQLLLQRRMTLEDEPFAPASDSERLPPPPLTSDAGQGIVGVDDALDEIAFSAQDASAAPHAICGDADAQSSAIASAKPAEPARRVCPSGLALATLRALRGPASVDVAASAPEAAAARPGTGRKSVVLSVAPSAVEAAGSKVKGAEGSSVATSEAPSALVPAVASAPLAFGHEALIDARTELGVHDCVAIRLGVSVATGKVRCAQVRLVAAAVEERERGITLAVKEGYGFLKRETREGQLFFAFGAIAVKGEGGGKGSGGKGSGGKGGAGAGATSVVVGDEFDFVVEVDPRSGKECATKLRALARGSVIFETPLQEGLRAVVSALTDGGGQLLSDEPYEGAPLRLPFGLRAVSAPKGALPALGTAVSFTLARSKAKGTLVAVAVEASPRSGTIERIINASKGIIRALEPLTMAAAAPAPQGGASAADEPEEGAESSTEAAVPTTSEAATSAAEAQAGSSAGTVSTLIFYATDVTDGNASRSLSTAELNVGDEVTFMAAVNPKNGELTAMRVVRTKEAPKPPEREEWTRKAVLDPSQVTRYAKGPNGTRGFARETRPCAISQRDAQAAAAGISSA